jgi:hypothetical protein
VEEGGPKGRMRGRAGLEGVRSPGKAFDTKKIWGREAGSKQSATTQDFRLCELCDLRDLGG